MSLERDQNDHDVFEALGKLKCDQGMSVENVSVVVNMKTRRGNLLDTSSLLNGRWGW